MRLPFAAETDRQRRTLRESPGPCRPVEPGRRGLRPYASFQSEVQRRSVFSHCCFEHFWLNRNRVLSTDGSVDGHTDSDLTKPSDERLRCTKLFDLQHRLNENVLAQLLRIRVVAQSSHCDCVNRWLESLEQFAESVTVASLCSANQICSSEDLCVCVDCVHLLVLLFDSSAFRARSRRRTCERCQAIAFERKSDSETRRRESKLAFRRKQRFRSRSQVVPP